MFGVHPTCFYPLRIRHDFLRLWLVTTAAVVAFLAVPGDGFSQPFSFATIAGLGGYEATVGAIADGTNSQARFYSPYGCALDGGGNLYVADGNAIRRVSPEGTNWVVTTLAGDGLVIGELDGSNNLALFDSPSGIAVDIAGNLYVADTINNSIRRVSLVGTNWVVNTLAGSLNRALTGSRDGTNRSALFSHPYGIAVDANTNIYVADTSNDTIRKVAPVGTNWVVTTLAGLVSNSASADGIGTNAHFNQPAAIAVDTNGNLYVADYGGDTIRRMTLAGTNWSVSTPAGLAGSSGSADGTNSNARFNGPFGIAVGASGTLFVSDGGNNTIRRVRLVGTNWVVSTPAGSPLMSGTTDGTGSGALFNVPEGIVVDPAGNVYVCDSANYTIRQGHLAPLLQVTLISSGAVLSWPVGLTGYVCEASANPNASSWSLHTNGQVVTGDNIVQTNAIQGGSMFFRLHKP